MLRVRLCLVLVLWALVDGEEHTRHGPRVPHDVDGVHDDDYDHQAILGSEELDDEFEGLPPEEARSRLADLIKQHDLNNDGIITKDEMAKWIKSSFDTLDAHEASDKMKEEDENEDGKVSWDEYLNKVYSFKSEDVENMRITVRESGDQTDEGREASSSLKMLEDDKLFFTAADVNGDGHLDREEYKAFFFPPNYPHMHEVELDRYIRDTDTDGDGQISHQEFMPEHPGGREGEISSEENFVDFDKNQDGFLSREEVKAWVLPETDEMIEEEVKHLFERADDDNNGELSTAEILAKTKEFVGSSATDYGSFLQGHDEF